MSLGILHWVFYKMRIPPQELFIMRLKGTLPKYGLPAYDWARSKTVEECLEGLRKLSGLDLGSDSEAWERWWAEERQRLDIDPDF
jgi:hypothetical protein